MQLKCPVCRHAYHQWGTLTFLEQVEHYLWNFIEMFLEPSNKKMRSTCSSAQKMSQAGPTEINALRFCNEQLRTEMSKVWIKYCTFLSPRPYIMKVWYRPLLIAPRSLPEANMQVEAVEAPSKASKHDIIVENYRESQEANVQLQYGGRSHLVDRPDLLCIYDPWL